MSSIEFQPEISLRYDTLLFRTPALASARGTKTVRDPLSKCWAWERDQRRKVTRPAPGEVAYILREG
jgi:hypothetical protein